MKGPYTPRRRCLLTRTLHLLRLARHKHEAELDAAMHRHPAGKQRTHT